MQFGILVLSLVVLFDIFFMVLVIRLVLTEPPHKRPAPHPLALEYATASEADNAPGDEASESDSAES